MQTPHLRSLPRSHLHTHARTEIVRLVDGGVDVNEVEAAGNTALHAAAYEVRVCCVGQC